MRAIERLATRLAAIAIVVLATILPGVDPARAAQTTGNLDVTARVGGYCVFSGLFVTNFAVAFGVYTPGSGDRDVTTTFGLRCSNGIPFQVELDGGGSGNVGNRQMSSTSIPTDKLEYQLYTDATRTTVWGDGSGGSAVASGTGGGIFAVRSFTVYGRVPDSAANQSAAVQTDYRDVVTITVTY
jgi:spore coat protein U-like protein